MYRRIKRICKKLLVLLEMNQTIMNLITGVGPIKLNYNVNIKLYF